MDGMVSIITRVAIALSATTWMCALIFTTAQGQVQIPDVSVYETSVAIKD